MTQTSSVWTEPGATVSGIDITIDNLKKAIEHSVSKKTVFGFLAHNVLGEILKTVGQPADLSLFRNKAADGFLQDTRRGIQLYEQKQITVQKFIMGLLYALQKAARPGPFSAISDLIDSLSVSEERWGDSSVSIMLANSRKKYKGIS